MGIRLMREPHADEFSTGRLYRRSGTSAEAAAGAAESARLHDTHRTIWAALKRKDLAEARRRAWATVSNASTSLESWRLVYCALRGH